MTNISQPTTLERRFGDMRRELVIRDRLLAFPFHWQVPAATEKAAYESIAAVSHTLPFEYIGFPWATVIDGLRGDAANIGGILMALKRISERVAGDTSRRATVAQHIHAVQFVELFKACGITDLFWSHATRDQLEIDGIRIHPFPLFPAQTPNAVPAGDLNRPRRYLANFIGAYNPKVYLSDVREVIFNDPNKAGDLLIVKRNAWHFDRIVYEEQIKGQRTDERRVQIENQNTEEYLNAIRDSWFTLCPSGSGPNSIRIFESLHLGSIPIVLTRDLRLPGPIRLWEKSVIIEEDSFNGYERAMTTARFMTVEHRLEKLRYGARLANVVSPRNYHDLIINGKCSKVVLSEAVHSNG